MDKKSFIWGILTGIVLTFVLIIIVGTLRQKTEEEDDTIQYLEQSVSYEGKKVTSFKVFQVLGGDDMTVPVIDGDIIE